MNAAVVFVGQRGPCRSPPEGDRIER